MWKYGEIAPICLPSSSHQLKRTIQRQRIVNDLPQIPHDKTFASVPASLRTNNNADAWHRRLNSIIHYKHLSLWVFIYSIQKEENYIHCQLVKTNARQSSQPSKKYLDYNKRLKTLVINPHSTLLR
jgi:hypothetical protein